MYMRQTCCETKLASMGGEGLRGQPSGNSEQLKEQDKLAPGPKWLTQFHSTYRALSQIKISENGSRSRIKVLRENGVRNLKFHLKLLEGVTG